METFFLQNNSGLYLTNDFRNELILKDQLTERSYGQTWYWQDNMLKCGSGRVLESCNGGLSVEASDPWPDNDNKQFYFQNIDNEKVLIGRFSEKDGEKEAFNENHKFLCILKNGESWQPIMSSKEQTDADFSWRKVPTDQAYKWKLMNSEELPEGAFDACSTDVGHGIFIGRGHFDGKCHLGKVQDGKRYIGFHNEDSMATEIFYLQNECGLYLTNVTNTEQLELAEFGSSPNQIWYWKEGGLVEGGRRQKLNDEKNILMNCNGNFLQMDFPGRETSVSTSQCASDYEDERNTFYLKHSEDGRFLIGRSFYKYDEDDVYLTFIEENGRKIAQMKSTENSNEGFRWTQISAKYKTPYNWVVMDSDELPANALEVGECKSENGDTANIFMGLGEVNGIIHPGKVIGGKHGHGERHIGFQCNGFANSHCGHCCFPSNDNDKCENDNQENIRKVTTEKFSVLCIDPETEVEWIKLEDGQLGDWVYDWSKFPNDAVMAGISTEYMTLTWNAISYVGRGLIDGELVPGLFQPRYNAVKLDIIHDGKMHQLEEFEVLVVKKGPVENYLKADKEKLYYGIDNEERLVTSEQFAVLCIEENACVKWVEYDYCEEIPTGAVIGGIFDEKIHYVGRGKVDDQIMPGMFSLESLAQTQTREQNPYILFVLHDGKTREAENFEFLVAETTSIDANI